MANKGKNNRQKTQHTDSQESSQSIVEWVLGLPRLGRILAALLAALAIAFLFTPITFGLHDRLTSTVDTLWIPFAITLALGVMMYVVGWYFIVGYAGEDPRNRRAVRWYVLMSVVAMILSVVWLILMILINAFIDSV